MFKRVVKIYGNRTEKIEDSFGKQYLYPNGIKRIVKVLRYQIQ
jgi:hypothetical protein